MKRSARRSARSQNVPARTQTTLRTVTGSSYLVAQAGEWPKWIASGCVAFALLWFGAARANALFGFGNKRFPAVENSHYERLCGECHYPHQPELLPRRSWEALMTLDALSNHFGIALQLPAAAQAELRTWLVGRAAETAQDEYDTVEDLLDAILPDKTPLRIAPNPYLKKLHKKVYQREADYVTNNEDVRFMGNCGACHGDQALQGVFDEDEVEIPSFGPW